MDASEFNSEIRRWNTIYESNPVEEPADEFIADHLIKSGHAKDYGFNVDSSDPFTVSQEIGELLSYIRDVVNDK